MLKPLMSAGHRCFIDLILRLTIYFLFHFSHQRTAHGQLHVPVAFEERDEFGYYLCRHHCGKTYKTMQGRNRYNSILLFAKTFIQQNEHCACLILGHMLLIKFKCILTGIQFSSCCTLWMFCCDL